MLIPMLLHPQEGVWRAEDHTRKVPQERQTDGRSQGEGFGAGLKCLRGTGQRMGSTPEQGWVVRPRPALMMTIHICWPDCFQTLVNCTAHSIATTNVPLSPCMSFTPQSQQSVTQWIPYNDVNALCGWPYFSVLSLDCVTAPHVNHNLKPYLAQML